MSPSPSLTPIFLIFFTFFKEIANTRLVANTSALTKFNSIEHADLLVAAAKKLVFWKMPSNVVRGGGDK